MDLTKKIKLMLGKNYCFKQYISVKEIENLKTAKLVTASDYPIAVLEAGTLKNIMVLFAADSGNKFGYDIYTAIDDDYTDFVCYENYDCPDDCDLDNIEKDMLFALDKVAKENNLSYTECKFKILDSSVISDAEVLK